MKKIAVLLMVLLLGILVFAQEGEKAKETEKAKYVGAEKCKICHNTTKIGKQYDIWAKGPHAKAYETLAGEEALKIGKAKGIDNPQKSSECLTCHVTAYAADSSLKEASLTMEEGVGCEACHGPGSIYKKMSIMKDREKAIASGLIIPDEKTCLQCHHDKSPTFKAFDYKERLKAIAHPIPKEEEESKG
jgi:hypothetical protein